jgi:tricorn protease
MFRYPTVSATQIAFVYAGDVWVAPKTGGAASRLSTPLGEEQLPRFSPDGKTLAFTANYDGNWDVYTVPSAGGALTRLTHHPARDAVLGWYPDGKSILISTPMAAGTNRFNQLYRLPATGGLPEKLPMPYGEFGAIGPDGKQIVYMPQTNDYRTWKRYRGGWAPDLWLFDFTTGAAENLTNSPANESQPMWRGRTLYFISDRDSTQRNNLFAMDLDKRTVRQLTHFTDYDITFPSIGPSDIVFQAGGRLYLLDLASEQSHEVTLQAVTDLSTLRPRVATVADLISDVSLAPTGERALFDARGDVFTLPAEHGPTRNLTASSGVAERSPAWSPDGKQVAYWSDRSGEYELYLRPADGSGAERKVTSLGAGFRYQPFWSPDGKRVAFIDELRRVRITELADGKTTTIDQQLTWSHGNLVGFAPSWSADSRWLAYPKEQPQAHTAIALYDVRSGKSTQVTTGFYNDVSPSFDPGGKYLYFESNRSFTPVYSDLDNSFIYPNSTQIVAVPLRNDVPSPLAPRSDEVTVKTDSAAAAPKDTTKKGKEKTADAKVVPDSAAKKAPAPVEIDLADFERRIVVLPAAAGNYGPLHAIDSALLYLRTPMAGIQKGESPLIRYDLKERKEETVVADLSGYITSANGKKVLVWKDDKYAIVDIKPGQKLEKPIDTGHMQVVVDPRAEWKQLFNDTWRMERDYFYDPGMHGVDWAAMKERYGKLIDDAVTRWDVNFILGELIAELNASHTYRGGGELESPRQRGVGLLGVDWKVENGAYRIAKILDGAAWDDEVRSPLRQPGVNVKEGDYVLAVDGLPLDPAVDPWAPFAGKAGTTVELLVNDKPTRDGARKVLVETLDDEGRLRNLAWIEANRQRVDQASGGRIGYVYVPSTGIDGQDELVRMFNGQFNKEGMIIDERFNSGGQIPDRFIELLNRPALAYWAIREGRDWQWPPVAHFGPKVMLINGWSGSGGDAFPYYFREAGLGPLIGQRTWGGLIGISGVPGLVDGGSITVPTFRMFNPKGEWFAEGHGVEPDIAVVDDPALMAKGGDPQLERAIQEAERLLKEKPATAPKHPPYEDRTAAGQSKAK